MSVGERIRTRRKELNMSQDELARRMGYKSRSTVNKIEKGINDITQSKIVAFAKVLKTTPAYIMGWEDEKDDLAHDVEFAEEFNDSFSLDRKKIWLKTTKGQSLSDDEFFKIIEYLKFIVSQRSDK